MLTFVDIELFPAFGYGLVTHVTTLRKDTHTMHDHVSKVATFHSAGEKLQLDVALQNGDDKRSCPRVSFKKTTRPGMQGDGLQATIVINEGESISFVLRNDSNQHVTEHITSSVLDNQQHDTQQYWFNFISQCRYKGRWREVVTRSLMILKLLTYGKHTL